MTALMDTAFASAATVEKFDCIHLQTPYHKFTIDELKAFPLGALSKDDSTIFIWTDSSNAATAMQLIDAYGFKFSTIAAIVNIAEALPVSEEEAKKSRVKLIQPYPWWPASETQQFTRPTCEQLWMATKGTGAALNPKYKTLPFQVIDKPELSKSKSKARQSTDSEWNCKRPDLLDQVSSFLAPESRIVDVFGDCLHANAAVLTPTIANGFVPAMESDEGIVSDAKKAFADMGKVSLRALTVKLRRSLSEDSELDETVTEVLNTAGTDWVSDIKLRKVMLAIADNSLTYMNRSKKVKRNKSKLDGTVKQGINDSSKVTPELCKFVNLPEGSQIARTKFVSFLSEYTKSHENMKRNKRIYPDEAIQSLFPETVEPIAFFKLYNAIENLHFPSKLKPELQEFMNTTEDALPKIQVMQYIDKYAEENNLVRTDEGIHPDNVLVKLFNSADVISNLKEAINPLLIKSTKKRSKKRPLDVEVDDAVTKKAKVEVDPAEDPTVADVMAVA